MGPVDFPERHFKVYPSKLLTEVVLTVRWILLPSFGKAYGRRNQTGGQNSLQSHL